MSSKSEKLTPRQLKVFEAKRNIGAEVFEAIVEMKAGGGHVIYEPFAIKANPNDASQPKLKLKLRNGAP